MFPTFTGSSRRSRNVNLSGQKTTNPFTSTSWAPNAAIGASKTVAHAQVERQQRQQERDRLRAALCIQKTWRGSRARRNFRTACRQALDQMYGNPDPAINTEQRSARAVPLVLAACQPSQLEDHDRLGRVAQDLLQTNFSAFSSGAVDATRLDKLSRLFITALERYGAGSTNVEPQVFLEALDAIIKARPQSLALLLGQYYRVLGRYCHQIGPSPPSLQLLRTVVVAPLVAAAVPGSFTQSAYREFALSFLTQTGVPALECNTEYFSAELDIDRLAESILAAAPAEPGTPEAQDALLWLLAHFIALKKAKKQHKAHSLYPKALYLLLSILAKPIRARFTACDPRGAGDDGEFEQDPQQALPAYVSSQLASLVDKGEISDLLEKFTSDHGETSFSELDDASFLAGYILTLIYCFPTRGDDIRMRLYLADITTRQGPIPAIKFFWGAVSKTSIFSVIVSNEDATLDVLLQKRSLSESTTSGADSQWHRQWRTILLFLELYVFVLRLMDDDDFFSELSPPDGPIQPVSRLRSSGLPMESLKRLTLFLKHLGFTLYYNAAKLLEAATGLSEITSGREGPFQPFTQKRNSFDVSQADKTPSFVITAGIDFNAFRDLVTAAMRMLYERDSRRPFLPKRHWLMTSKFDMEAFLSAVVLEQKRQHELQEEDNEGGENAGEDEMETEYHSNFTFAGQTRFRHVQMEQLRAQQKKAARQRLLAAIGPKLEILRHMPFVIPFETRVQIFRQFIRLDKVQRRGGDTDPDMWRMRLLNSGGGLDPNSPSQRSLLTKHHAQIKRGQVFRDAMNEFWELGDGLKEPIQITFVDEFDIQEAGIDGGGVTKEFLTSVTKESFTQDQRLFITNNKNAFYPNPCAIDQQREALREAGIPEESAMYRDSMNDLLKQYEFLGRVIGKCMYEGILIDINFAGFFLLKWSSANAADSYRANINDLHDLDEELYQGMLRLKNYTGDVSDLALDFTITDQVSLPNQPVRTVTRNLIPNGDEILVTNENRPLYISYVARHRLAVQPYAQTRAFLRGLGMIIDPAWLAMFNQTELQRLVGGDSSEIDVEDLRRHTEYSGVYAIGDDGQEHPTVRLFWEVMHQLQDHERRDVLKYVTSTPRAPLLGFSQLSPAFTIRDGGQDQERLPSASTCVNLLKLPQYRSAAVLKSKLLYAVTSGAGFDLS
ncbi:hypothetical protein B0T19DRAFT_96051 [Cercophora scortea]|uniref:HECT-type E3 ubiquitin transferase n=1 Tax=Cercophora scortea TaxID=314031 RepID=A0AAE0IW30_9PEZI|nr:hypothetical protein B0T19DRAFT_96051 [Cercophora scortea]